MNAKQTGLFKECTPGEPGCDMVAKFDDLLERFAMALWNGRIARMCPVMGGFVCPELDRGRKCHKSNNHARRAVECYKKWILDGGDLRDMTLHQRELIGVVTDEPSRYDFKKA